MSDDVSLAEVVTAGIDARLLDLHTAMPGRVESYNASANTVNVTPMQFRQVPTDDGDYVTEQLPEIPDVKLVYQRAGGFGITFPVQKGDFVLLVFCEHALGAWRSNGQAGDPGDPERHGMSGAVAIPGIFPDQQNIASPDTTNMVLGKLGTPAAQIEITPTEVHIGAGATSFIALADKVLTELNKVATAFNSHVHVVAGTCPSGGGALTAGTAAAPVAQYTSAAVAAATSKAK